MYLGLAWNSPCIQGWPQFTENPSITAHTGAGTTFFGEINLKIL